MKPENFRLRPTALWIIFGPVLACMWIAAVNYSNNLVYAILYLIASLSGISIFHTWRNLAALRIEHVRVQPAFAGEEVRVEIHLRNVSQHTVFGLFFTRVVDEVETSLAQRVMKWNFKHPVTSLLPPRRIKPLRSPDGRGVRIGPEDTCAVEVGFSSERRGIYRFEAMLVRTYYPFGLFWASFRVPVGVEYFVYPKPKGSALWPSLYPSGEAGSPASNRPGDDFAGVRAYVPGESLRHVDWKAFARGRPLSVKQFTGGAGQELWLDAGEMNRLPLEARLSQLALWIVNAEKEEIPYALRLGRTTLPLGLGPAQYRRALETLAVAGVGSS
jgi:uncharacterized protein (DUF58 family)